MSWLVRQSGPEHLWDMTVVCPTPEFFPDPYDASDDAIGSILGRVCVYMGIDPTRVDLFVHDENGSFELGRGFSVTQESSYAAGLYHGADRRKRRQRISVDHTVLDDPVNLIATFTHELCHVHLLGDKRLTGEEADHEELTDLATVFFGLGVFNANTVVRDTQWTDGQWAGWRVSRGGYLTEPDFAYAHALVAYLRNERKPSWATHLRSTVRSMFIKNLRYLFTTNDAPLKSRRITP